VGILSPLAQVSAADDTSGLETAVKQTSCVDFTNVNLGGCLVKIAYYTVYTIPSALLGLSGLFFDAVLSLALDSTIYAASFVDKAWSVVRDLSNIFFILILLYVAIQTILGLSHEAKKTIVKVIVLALLINFSMFFTKIVIDTSNVLALVFYNRINVNVTGTQRQYSPLWSPVKHAVAEKDIAGGIYSAFDPSRLMSPEFFERAKQKTTRLSWLGAAAYIGGGAAIGGPIGAVVGAGGALLQAAFGTNEEVPISLMLTIIIVTGAIIGFAAYAFFYAGISFINRIVELWVLIIFSPFAFMSSSVPLLSHVERIGWDEWLKKLFKVSFLAPIFLFFVYLIYLFVQIPFLKDLAVDGANQDTFQVMLLIILQSLIILGLLKKAIDYAKKSSGQLGEMLVKGGKAALGIAGGLALGGTAQLLQGTVGQFSSRVANSRWAKRYEASGRLGGTALRNVAKFGASASFDLRKGAAGATLGALHGVTGLNLGHSTKFLTKDGGFEADRKRKVELRQKRAQELEVGEDEELKQHLNQLELDKQALLSEGNHEIEQIDNRIKSAQAAVAAAKDRLRGETAQVGQPGSANYIPASDGYADAQRRVQEAATQVDNLRSQKSAIKNANGANVTALQNAAAAARQAANTARQAGAANAQALIDAARAAEVAVRVARRSAEVAGGRSINNLEDYAIPEAHHHIEEENRNRRLTYANYISNGILPNIDFLNAGGRWVGGRAQAEAAHKIRMKAKIENHDKGSGGHGLDHFLGDLAAGAITNALSSHGHESGGNGAHGSSSGGNGHS